MLMHAYKKTKYTLTIILQRQYWRASSESAAYVQGLRSRDAPVDGEALERATEGNLRPVV